MIIKFSAHCEMRNVSLKTSQTPGIIISFFASPRFCPTPIVDCVCAASLWCHCLERGELSTSLSTDVTVASLELPCETSDGRGRLQARLVQPADIVAVFGWVVLHGLNFDAFLLSELQNGEDAPEFTDHPVLQRENVREQ